MRLIPLRKGPLRKLFPKKPPQPELPSPSVAATPETIGERVRMLRTSRKMSQAELAGFAGMDRTEITRIEGGQDPKFKTLQKIARGLRIPLSEMVKGLD